MSLMMITNPEGFLTQEDESLFILEDGLGFLMLERG